MASSHDDLLQRAIELARSGQREEARQLLAQVLRVDAQNETAWLWLGAVLTRPEDRIRCLQQVLTINPRNEMAARGLRALGVEPPPPPPPESGVPRPDPAAIAEARRRADLVLTDLRHEIDAGRLELAWAAPDAERRTARLPLYMRVDPLAVAIVGSIAVVVLVVVLASTILGMIRPVQRGVAPQVAQGVLPTPTTQPTPRPTRTPTPVGAGVIEPTLPAGNAPRGDLRFGLTPTAIYINTPHPALPRLSDAITAYAQGRYQDALELIAQVRENGDESIDGYYYEVMSLIGLERFDDARARLTVALGRNENFAPLHVAEGILLARAGAVERARVSFERARDIDPLYLRTYLELADLSLAEGDYDSAQAQIDAARATNRYSYDVNLLVAEGEIALARGDVARAVALGNLAFYIDPGAEDVVVFLARSRIEFGAIGAAVIGLEDYLADANPASARAWALLGTAYGLQDRFDEGFLAYQRALQLSENVTEALIARGYFYMEQRQVQNAFDDFEAALASEPGSRDALAGHAMTGIELGQFEAAIADLEKLRANLTPPDPNLETLYVRALLGARRYADVITVSSAALNLALDEGQRAALFEARGWAYFNQDDLASADRDIRQALAIEQTGTRLFYQANILLAQGQLDQAASALEWLLFWDQSFDYPFSADAAALLADARSQIEARDATPTPTPTITPFPTSTPRPTATPFPTATPRPTATPAATATSASP